MGAKISKIKGQSLSEHSLFLVAILIAGISMTVYIKRGLQGRYADATDYTINTVRLRTPPTDVLGMPGTPYKVLNQYEPYYLNVSTNVTAPREIKETITVGGKTTKVMNATSTIVESSSKEGQRAYW
jgi:hypothetical protein